MSISIAVSPLIVLTFGRHPLMATLFCYRHPDYCALESNMGLPSPHRRSDKSTLRFTYPTYPTENLIRQLTSLWVTALACSVFLNIQIWRRCDVDRISVKFGTAGRGTEEVKNIRQEKGDNLSLQQPKNSLVPANSEEFRYYLHYFSYPPPNPSEIGSFFHSISNSMGNLRWFMLRNEVGGRDKRCLIV